MDRDTEARIDELITRRLVAFRERLAEDGRLIGDENSMEADMLESTLPQACPGWPPAELPLHEHSWPQVEPPHPTSHDLESFPEGSLPSPHIAPSTSALS